MHSREKTGKCFHVPRFVEETGREYLTCALPEKDVKHNKKPQQQQEQTNTNAVGGLLEEDILGLNLISNGGMPETIIGAGAPTR